MEETKKIGFSEKSIVPCIPKMTRFHNFESTVTIVFQFYSMKGIERQIQISLSDFLPKKHVFGK